VKKFKYKLEALLKLRKFKESRLKVELGVINSDIAKTQDIIVELKKNIESTYKDQEEVLSSPTSGQMAQFYPRYIQGRREDIINRENLIYSLKKKYQNKLEELSLAMAETKVIQKMKDKDFQAYVKNRTKKENNDLEELYLITNQHRNNG
jgi:flagellar FliJ protein